MKDTILEEPPVSGNGEMLNGDIFKRQLLAALTALGEGEFSTRLPRDLTGLDGKIADAFNEVVGRLERFDNGLVRLRTEVGRKGKFDERLQIGDAIGGWARSVEPPIRLWTTYLVQRLKWAA